MEVLSGAGSKLVVVDFFATWCGPCKFIAPKLVELQEKYADKVVIIKVDIEKNLELVDHYRIQSMPTFMFFKELENVDQFSGADAEKLVEVIEKHTA